MCKTAWNNRFLAGMVQMTDFFSFYFFPSPCAYGKKWYNEDDIKDKEEMS